MIRVLTILLIFPKFLVADNVLHRESCFSPVYCHGNLLHMVQTAHIFNDSKTFVDLSMINSINETLEYFQDFLITRKNPNPTDIKRFVYENFHSVGEIEEYWPADFNATPPVLDAIEDEIVRKYTEHIISLWPTLARKVTRPVLESPDSYSIIPVAHGFIIPGGRFKEIYYWDTYWIVHGLLISNMFETAKGMILNLLSLIERYGFIPNGTRVYYLNRSQPPLVVPMVNLYYSYTNNLEFIEENIETLEKEMTFWLTKRTVRIEKGGNVLRLARYGSSSDTPRPESYIEDIETCEQHETEEEIHDCFTDLKAGAESGWDFSTRWIFDSNGQPTGNLSMIQTRRNVPVDLNSFLYMNFMLMYKFYLKLGRSHKANKYLELAQEWRNAIEILLWHEEDGTWYDFDLKLRKPRRNFYPSNISPLWAKAMDPSTLQLRARRTIDYLKNSGIFDFLGGIPSSFIPSGQQWDYPNAWSPSQAIAIFGLEESGDPEAMVIAKLLATTWVRSNIKAFFENRVMFEKYNAQYSGQYGGGGEYVVQSGFGWSNGVMLELINFYYVSHKIPERKKK